MSRLSDEFERVPKSLTLPAVRFRRNGGVPQIAVWCPVCEIIHVHGDAAGATMRRVHHYVDDRYRDHPVEYELFPVGNVGSPRNAPRLSVDEALAFDALVNRRKASPLAG